MRAALLSLAVLCLPAAGLTANEVAELHHAGTPDAAIISAFRADGSVFRLSPAKLAALRAEGLSEPLLAAMLATAEPVAPALPRYVERQPAPVVILPVPLFVPVLRPVAPPPVAVYTIREPRPWFVLGPAGSYVAPPTAWPRTPTPAAPCRPPAPAESSRW